MATNPDVVEAMLLTHKCHTAQWDAIQYFFFYSKSSFNKTSTPETICLDILELFLQKKGCDTC